MDTIHTILAFDFGLRHIGVAVGQKVTHTATALAEISAKDGMPSMPQMEKLMQTWRPDLLLVGLPLHMDGTESEMSEKARHFARRLRARFSLPCEMVDERLSSFAAERTLAENTEKPPQHSVHSHAARLILCDWLADKL